MFNRRSKFMEFLVSNEIEDDKNRKFVRDIDNELANATIH